MLDKDQLIELLKKNLNIGGLVADVLDDVLEPALKKVVADTSNPFDDVLMASVYPVLEEKLKEEVAELINKI